MTHALIHEKTRTLGRGLWSLLASVAVMAAMAVPLSLLGPNSVAGAAASAATCGTPNGSPAPLPGGTYSSVDVQGVCFISAGQVTVTGNVTLEAGTSLIALFATDGGTGTSGITVQGNVDVGPTATLILGCEAQEIQCIDDSSANVGDTVDGNIISSNPLGVVIHESTIGGDIVSNGGGGGVSCEPTGVFNEFGSPVYSDYEDNTIGGNLRVTGLNSCWFGALRNTIGGSAMFQNNVFADPDAMENLTNTISGNLLCSGNNPQTEYGDSGGSPNIVGGFATGECAFGVMQPSPAPTPGNGPGPLMPISQPSTTAPGYWMAGADGGVFAFKVPFFGSQSGTALSQPITGIAAVPGGNNGYNIAEGNGMVYGDGPRASDCANSGAVLNQTIVSIAAAPGGNGCWLAGSSGAVISLGTNAPFFGSASALPLTKPIVGIAAAPNNDGYTLVASDGGIFTYGPGAQYYGSMGGKPLNQPIVGIAIDPSTGGYWEVAKDGGVFAFNAPFLGSMGGKPINKPIVGIAAAPNGNGYYLVASDGGIFAFGSGATFQGSTGGIQLTKPVVGMALG